MWIGAAGIKVGTWTLARKEVWVQLEVTVRVEVNVKVEA